MTEATAEIGATSQILENGAHFKAGVIDFTAGSLGKFLMKFRGDTFVYDILLCLRVMHDKKTQRAGCWEIGTFKTFSPVCR